MELFLGNVVTIACTGALFVGRITAFVTIPDADPVAPQPTTEEEMARAAERALAPDGLAFITSARRNGRPLGSMVNRMGVKWLPGAVTADSPEGKALLVAEAASPHPVQHYRVESGRTIVAHHDAAN